MQLMLEPDGSYVSTPLYVGTTEDIDKMLADNEHVYRAEGEPSPGPHPDKVMQLERCTKCGAVRSRLRGTL